jgi:hypothetical protein
MKTLKNFVSGIGSFALAAMFVALVAPKAVHAVVATLVQVVNTTANPVPNLDTERNARIPYQHTAQSSSCSINCQFNMPAVPAGYRLVAQNASAYVALTLGSANAPIGSLGEVGGGFLIGLTGALGTNSGSAPGSVTFAGVTQTVTAYFDAGQTPFLTVAASFAAGQMQFATLTGYLENCSITGCPAIQ